MKHFKNSILILCSAAGSLLPFQLWAGHPNWGPEPPVAPYTRARLPIQNDSVGIIFPVIGRCRWRDDYNANRGPYRHTGIDIRAPKMSPIVAPFSGLLGMKRESFWIFGDNGWAMLGTHLNDDDLGTHNHRGSRDVMFAPELTPGQRVIAGQFIGYVGMSGDATGPHLHFELYAPGGGKTMDRIRDPFPSLKRAQVIRAPRMASMQELALPRRDEIRLQGCVRKISPSSHSITVLLTAKQTAKGFITAQTHIRYLHLRVSDAVLAQVGGWDQLTNLPATQSLGFYIYAGDNPEGSLVHSISDTTRPLTVTPGLRGQHPQ